jgi:hypothetical protein
VSAHIFGDLGPVLQWVKAAFDGSHSAPQQQHGHRQFLLGGAVHAVMLEVDAGGGAVILAGGVNGGGIKAAFVRRPSFGRERI